MSVREIVENARSGGVDLQAERRRILDLIKSNPAVGKKVKLLMDEGKPQKQAVAIALDMQRRGELGKSDVDALVAAGDTSAAGAGASSGAGGFMASMDPDATDDETGDDEENEENETEEEPDEASGAVQKSEPSGQGWEAIPGGHASGKRRKAPGSNRYEYWYPTGDAHLGHLQAKMTQALNHGKGRIQPQHMPEAHDVAAQVHAAVEHGKIRGNKGTALNALRTVQETARAVHNKNEADRGKGLVDDNEGFGHTLHAREIRNHLTEGISKLANHKKNPTNEIIEDVEARKKVEARDAAARSTPIPAGMHRIKTGEGPKDVPTTARHGNYAVHSVGDPEARVAGTAAGHTVTHVPTGLAVATGVKSKAAAAALARHMDAHAPHELETAKFGEMPGKQHAAEMSRMGEALKTFDPKTAQAPFLKLDAARGDFGADTHPFGGAVSRGDLERKVKSWAATAKTDADRQHVADQVSYMLGANAVRGDQVGHLATPKFGKSLFDGVERIGSCNYTEIRAPELKRSIAAPLSSGSARGMQKALVADESVSIGVEADPYPTRGKDGRLLPPGAPLARVW